MQASGVVAGLFCAALDEVPIGFSELAPPGLVQVSDPVRPRELAQASGAERGGGRGGVKDAADDAAASEVLPPGFHVSSISPNSWLSSAYLALSSFRREVPSGYRMSAIRQPEGVWFTAKTSFIGLGSDGYRIETTTSPRATGLTVRSDAPELSWALKIGSKSRLQTPCVRAAHSRSAISNRARSGAKYPLSTLSDCWETPSHRGPFKVGSAAKSGTHAKFR